MRTRAGTNKGDAVDTTRYLRMRELADAIAASTDDDEAWALYNEAERERRAESHDNPMQATRWFHASTVAYRARTQTTVST